MCKSGAVSAAEQKPCPVPSMQRGQLACNACFIGSDAIMPLLVKHVPGDGLLQ
jgi:hypothetical protein